MSDIKIIKNTTVININLSSVGIVVPLLGQITVPTTLYSLFSTTDALTEINPYLISGSLVINDGLSDLSPAEGYRFLEIPNRPIVTENGIIKVRYPDKWNFTGNVTVNEEPNGTVKVGVLEDDDEFVGQLWGLAFTQTGTTSNKWLRVIADEHPSDIVHFKFPFGVKLVAITFTNTNDNTRFYLEIYKALNNDTNNDSLIFSLDMNNINRRSRNFTRRNADNSNVNELTDVTFALGDKIGVYLRKGISTQPSDPLVHLWFKITDSTKVNTLENYSGNF